MGECVLRMLAAIPNEWERHAAHRLFTAGRALRSGLGWVFIFCMTALCWGDSQSQQLAELSSQGRAALEQEQFDRAEKVYEQVVKLDPRSAEARSNLGLALYMTGSYTRAIEQLRKALELDPHLDRTQVLLALSYFNTGELGRAIPLLEKA